MILLDSNIIIYLSKRKLSVADVFSLDATYAVSIVTYMEIFSYVFADKAEEKFLRDIFSALKIIDLNREIAEHVTVIRKQRKLKLPDSIIVATAIAEDAMLLTGDKQLATIDGIRTQLIAV